jgi:glutathione peroxidase
MSVYAFKAKDIGGKEISLDDFRGQALLIVNVASQCGFTPQYESLEKLYEKYKDKGFAVLGFPCNQFGKQEPATEEDIQKFCTIKFGAKFPMFSKIDVNGAGAHPLFKYLVSERPGILGTESIKWNFTKFLVNKKGEPVKRFAPIIDPKDIEKDLLEVL